MKEAITSYYDQYDEDGRLERSWIHRLEFATNWHYLKKYIPKGARVFDGCAGTGRYAFALAEEGYQVWAGDLTSSNVDTIRKKDSGLLKGAAINDMTDMEQIGDAFFDAVLCMGAFYHLDAAGRERALAECLRILKPGGVLVIAYINRLAAAWLELNGASGDTAKALQVYQGGAHDQIFECIDCLELEKTASAAGVKVAANAASEGPLFMAERRQSDMTEEKFKEHLGFHLQTCESRAALGMSIHGLLIGYKAPGTSS